MSMREGALEFNLADWPNLPSQVRRRRIVFACDGRCRFVFQCRSETARYACGRYVCSCYGGSDDDRCADCWVRFQRALKRDIVRHVRAARFRIEDAMCLRFGESGRHDDPVVEDALYELVRERRLEWFGARDDLSTPLRYRIPERAAC